MASVMEHLTRGASAMSQIARDGASGFFAGGPLAEPGGACCSVFREAYCAVQDLGRRIGKCVEWEVSGMYLTQDFFKLD